MNWGSSFLADERTLLGTGKRRRCYRLQGTGLCAKFYHDPLRLPARTRLSVRVNIAWGCLCRAMNINYREWRYHQYFLRSLPHDLARVFPEHTEPVHCLEKGWGIIETLILNADGSLPKTVTKELKNSQNPKQCLVIYQETEHLLQRFAEYGVRFFDLSNILVQWLEDGTFRLRVADFEPDCRAIIPGLSHIGFYVRCKIRRRTTRYLAMLRNILAEKQITLSVAQARASQHDPFFKRVAIVTGLL